jgi:predicted secreted hydrolase
MALPGYRFEFPRDHVSHPDYETEWWYYTGNLRTADGHKYGFELTFFRRGSHAAESASTSAWDAGQIYFAHLALSDLDGGSFYHTERWNRAGPGLAGADLASRRIWNGNWKTVWAADFRAQELEAVCGRFTLRLHLAAAKPYVIHGKDGVSQKGWARGEASHYISFPRLDASGSLEQGGKRVAVTGLAWMDHEFFTEPLGDTLRGWDWFSIQLDSNEEIMLYRLHNGLSSGTYIDNQGRAHFLDASDCSVTPGETWHSAASGGSYPVTWSIRIPSLGLSLKEETKLEGQELFTAGSRSPAYWEGAVGYEGSIHQKPVHGVGYLEMTGYAAGQRPSGI